ncbi:hypothetical protein [Methanococcoides methylutens]
MIGLIPFAFGSSSGIASIMMWFLLFW